MSLVLNHQRMTELAGPWHLLSTLEIKSQGWSLLQVNGFPHTHSVCLCAPRPSCGHGGRSRVPSESPAYLWGACTQLPW